MRIAIVTGASSGMGREMVFQLADRFASLDEIWVVARRADRLEQLKAQLPVRLRIFPINITDPIALTQLSDALKEHRPKVKFLVNSAGFGKIGSCEGMEASLQTGMIRLNCEALCHVTHIVLPYLSDNGRILQFASSAAFMPQPRFAVYAATKAFVLSYSRALGYELKARNIYVTAVCPGPVRTEFFDIAETTEKITLYKKLAMADPKKVVSLAIRDSIMKKPVSVYGGLMKAFHLISKLLPHELLLSVMDQLK